MNREAVLNRDHVSDVDSLRANVYRLMARALSRPVDRPFLDLLAGLSGDDTDIGRAFGDLAETASATSLEAAREEYQNLFIGLGRGEILPYASYYLTGFLNEKPLARLRNDMVPLGIERDPSVKEPEDHAGALMDMMAGLIEGSFGADQPMTVQKEFFQKHLFSWMPHLYRDIQRANSARLYKPLGRVGEVFMEIEKAAFDM